MGLALLCGEVARDLGLPRGPQPGGAILDLASVDSGHPGCRGAGAGGIGKDVKPGEVALLDEVQRLLEHLIRFGGEACDDIGPERHVGAQGTGLLAKADGVVA